MKILITGAAGFIGFHVSRRLMMDGHEVVGLDNLIDNGDLDLKYARMAQLGIDIAPLQLGDAEKSPMGDFTFVKADALDFESMDGICAGAGFDAIVHLAAAGNGLSNDSPVFYLQSNVNATQNMLEAARRNGVKHVFFSSTSAVYGPHAKSPIAEEDDVDNPLSLYGGCKRMCELLCTTYASTYKLPVTVFRFFSAYGPWGRPHSDSMRIAFDIMNGKPVTVLNDGYIVRDFTYIDDIVDGIVFALMTPPQGVRPFALYNIGRSQPVPYMAFAQAIETALGIPATIRTVPDSPLDVGENIELYADTSKLDRELAYSPVWMYTEAIPIFIDWFKQYYGLN